MVKMAKLKKISKSVSWNKRNPVLLWQGNRMAFVLLTHLALGTREFQQLKKKNQLTKGQNLSHSQRPWGDDIYNKSFLACYNAKRFQSWKAFYPGCSTVSPWPACHLIPVCLTGSGFPRWNTAGGMEVSHSQPHTKTFLHHWPSACFFVKSRHFPLTLNEQ